MPVIQTTVRNFSRYPVDVVWENAQDLEHVPFLHGDTNKDFTLLHAHRETGSTRVYDCLVYEAVRRVRLLTFRTFGFRRIAGERQIHQVERIPALGVTSALNSLLFESGDPERPTLMQDEIVMEVPAWLYPLRSLIVDSLRHHAAVQCLQDEPFRARRAELARRGVDLPYRLFNESVYERLTSRFQERAPAKVSRP